MLDGPHDLTVDNFGNIFVVNGAGNSITIYSPNSTGNVAPVASISGANTGLSNPNGIAVDNAGNIYVGNGSAIAIFAAIPAGAQNVAPAVTISGSSTGLTAPIHGVAVY